MRDSGFGELSRVAELESLIFSFINVSGKLSPSSRSSNAMGFENSTSKNVYQFMPVKEVSSLGL